MVEGEDLGLDAEERLGVADVVLENLRHVADGFEELRIDRAEVADDGVLLVDDVVGDRAVVRVSHDLHTVADVVEAAAGERGRAEAQRGEVLAVGIAVARRERVVDPVQLPIRDDEIGVRVVLEERGDRSLARDDRAAEQDLALRIDLVRHEEVGEIAEPERE